MSKRVFAVETLTPVGVLDTANFTASGYMAIQGGSTTQMVAISEIYLGGQATASAPTPMLLARDSTTAVTPSALSTAQSDGALDPTVAALAAPPIPFVSASTEPQRAATLSRLALGFNAFGGIVRWVAPDPTSYFKILGNTASLGEASLSCYTGGTPGLLNAHIIYEPM